MKILHIHPSLAGGGIEAIICALVNEMVKRHDVTMATIFAPKDSDVFEKKLDKRVKRTSLGKEKPGFSLSEIFKIFRLIRKGNYDVVHIHGFFYYYAMSVLLLHHKVKFFYTIHSDAVMENSPWDKRFLWLKKWCFKKRLIKPITISPASKDSFTKLYGTDSTLICNGVSKPTITTTENPLGQYKITPSTKIFIHAGRINVAKNQVVLCKSFLRLVNSGYDAVLLIAGGNHDDAIMQQLQPFFGDRIVYLGERNDIPTLFYFADAMCLPSIWEGLPVTLLESLAVGCAPICSPVGGIVNVVSHGYNGLLSKDSSVECYYETLEEYMKMTNEEQEKMSKNCMESFAPYDIKQTATRYELAYKS
ncbi:MAG: glycosyltransferase family 4 protein [Alistipes sp.]|nr:glycosyltransferase family 4 protein [Alistipes sp.]